MSFEGFTAKKKKKTAEINFRQPIEYKKISEDKYGLNIAVIGTDMTGKTCLSTTYGYFNSKYVNKLDKKKFPKSIELLKGGYMPEVERIVVLDLDNSFEKSASRGIFSQLIKPLRPIIEVETIYIPKRQSSVSDGKVVDFRGDELFKAKRKIEDAIDVALKDYGSDTLFIIDSMSSYYEVLNSMFSIVYEAAFDKTAYAHVKDQKQWQIRNAWWSETMKKKRKFPGWQIDTVKVVPIPKQWVKTKTVDRSANPFNIKWAEGGGDNAFNLDQIYWIKRDADGFAYFDTVNARYKSITDSENKAIYYELNKRDAAFHMIEHMAPHIMGEGIKEEDLW